MDPFETPFNDLLSDLDSHVDAVFRSLGSESLASPEGNGCPASSVLDAITDTLTRAGVSHRRTRRGERLDGFCQAPDFVVPTEPRPSAVIIAANADDDGTARDTLTRIQYLAALSVQDQPRDQPTFEVIACISGGGFGVRHEAMKKLLLATRGKVFTAHNTSRLVAHTSCASF